MKSREVNIHSQHGFTKGKPYLSTPATLYGRMGWLNQQSREELLMSSTRTSARPLVQFLTMSWTLNWRERFHGHTIRWIRDCLNLLAMAKVSVCQCLDVQGQTSRKRTLGSWWMSWKCVSAGQKANHIQCCIKEAFPEGHGTKIGPSALLSWDPILSTVSSSGKAWDCWIRSRGAAQKFQVHLIPLLLQQNAIWIQRQKWYVILRKICVLIKIFWETHLHNCSVKCVLLIKSVKKQGTGFTS